MADDFVEPDMFDPEAERFALERSVKTRGEDEDRLREYTDKIRRCYRAVFSTGSCNQDDLDFVMQDLAKFTRAYEPTFDINGKVQDMLEGRRSVFHRIMKHTMLDSDTLFVQYSRNKAAQ